MPISNQDLRKAGLKVTLPRIKILELLENSRQHHLSAEDIYKTLLEQGEDVGLATVYRVLTQFEAAGIIQRHHFENNEHQQHEVAEKYGFTLTGHSLNLYGYCDSQECQDAYRKK